ncbi:gamma-glutamyltransferase family protein [Effusibacillus pohliae]|uniref:gamma-glutamyltransferase family protein n=1 Tax=Effusibacillus pohliae TaxID=232270 RepID=UPI00036DBA25|nr:gamma-glutamyltransferase family protein [Effusibacillus pohliae]
MNYDSLSHPYPSRRMPVYAKNGMVATSQPLAAQAGLQILRQGGNAIDAAIATAAALTVVEPTSNGIGGDAFALVWTQGKLHGLNSSGPAPQSISIDALQKAGVSEIPKYGWIPVTVPGAPAAWAELSAKFGRLPLTEVLRPAIEYAEHGYPLTPVLGYFWKRAFEVYSETLKGEEFKAWFDTFAPQGRAPRIGEVWRSPDHARTLQLIAETKAEAFYRGELAERIDHFSRQSGGYLRKEDLAAFQPEWVDPICVNYRGYDVWEIPPNGHGLVALMALNILKGFEFSARDTVDTYHKQIEAIKLAFADGKKYIADPRSMSARVEDLLSDAYAAERRRLIGRTALQPEPGQPPRGGTVYLCTADGEGNMVSYIQSNYMGFGSGLVVPGTGIALHNRGHNFTLDPAHDNRLEPGKKPYHTIIPGFLTKDGQPVGPFGVMGGFMQPQGHVQVVMNTVDFHLNPQAALDAPRWQWMQGKTVEIEHSAPAHVAEALARMGHDVKWAVGSGGFGRGQIIWRQANGVLVGGTEPRTDGQVAAW